MRHQLIAAMLAIGLFLAGVVVAVVLLEFDWFDETGRTVAIAGLVVASVTMVLASIKMSRLQTEANGVARSPADEFEQGVGPAPLAGTTGRSTIVEEDLVSGQSASGKGDSEGSASQQSASELARPGDGKEVVREVMRASAHLDSKEEQLGDGQDEPLGSYGQSTGTDPSESETRAAEPDFLGASGEIDTEDESARPDLSLLRESVIGAWREYLRRGDGHFNADGLREQLKASGLEVSVKSGVSVGAADNVLLVEILAHSSRRFLVVPSFTKSPRAAPDWFDDASDGVLTRRTRRIHRLAEGVWTESGFDVVEKGRIE